MDETTAEVFILAINALGTGILFFIARVIQKIMDDMDEPAFKQFLPALVRTAMSDHFTVTVATLPIIAALLYFWAFGFHHWWFTAGFIVWIIGSTITKISNMPIYRWAGDPKNNDPAELRKQRGKLGQANNRRAWLSLASVVLMACQFGVPQAMITVALSVVIAFPLIRLARKYIPNQT